MSWQILRPASIAFLVTTSLYGLGCLTLPDFSADDGGEKDGGGGTGGTGGGVDIPEDLPDESAFFIFQATDLRSDAWPDAWTGMDLLVCNPALSAADIALIRAGLPGVRLLAYTNVQDIRLGHYEGNPYFDALGAAFDSTWCLRRVDNGEIINIQGWDGTPGSGVPAWIVQRPSAEAVVAFHRDVTLVAGYDGLYVDNCSEVYPPWRQAIILEQTSSFDYDGDGLADSMADLLTEYEASRAYFTARLREVLGADAVLIGNAGGALADPALNGITLEGVGDRFPATQARSLFLAAQEVSRAPWLAVAWATTSASVEGCRGVAEALPGVHFGVVADATPAP